MTDLSTVIIRRTGGQVITLDEGRGKVSIGVLNGKTAVTFDPFNNADDDYAVRQWMLENNLEPDSNYKVGDFARQLLDD